MKPPKQERKTIKFSCSSSCDTSVLFHIYNRNTVGHVVKCFSTVRVINIEAVRLKRYKYTKKYRNIDRIWNDNEDNMEDV